MQFPLKLRLQQYQPESLSETCIFAGYLVDVPGSLPHHHIDAEDRFPPAFACEELGDCDLEPESEVCQFG